MGLGGEGLEIKSVLETFRTFGGNTAFCILSLLAFVVIGCMMKEKYRKYYLCSAVLLVLLCYNELAHKVILKMGGGDTYYRFFWILCMTIMISMSMCYIWKCYAETKVKKWFILLLLLAICIFGGNTYIQKEAFALPSNVYKIPDEMIIISNVIHEDANTEGEIQVLGDYGVMQCMRQYDASLCLTLGIDTYRGLIPMDEQQTAMCEVVVNKNFQNVNHKDFQHALKEYNVQYIVVVYSEDLDSYLTECGMRGVCPVGLYGIYGVDFTALH